MSSKKTFLKIRCQLTHSFISIMLQYNFFDIITTLNNFIWLIFFFFTFIDLFSTMLVTFCNVSLMRRYNWNIFLKIIEIIFIFNKIFLLRIRNCFYCVNERRRYQRNLLLALEEIIHMWNILHIELMKRRLSF